MLKLGGAVIHMQLSLIDNISFCVGDKDILMNMQNVPAMEPFSDRIIEFLNATSKKLLADAQVKKYPDIVTLAFWMRRASIDSLKKRFDNKNEGFRLGRGVVFHIAPSNVPVNYAYSLVAGLLCGNANIVRISSKQFEQINIINNAITEVLNSGFADCRPYIVLVRYGHEQSINDTLSDFADARIIWGGDMTIGELYKSKLSPRAIEIKFADRYSLAVINSDDYLAVDNKVKVAKDFYNDTYLTDQNACTSPRIVVWMGESISKAKEMFWSELHKVVVEAKYMLQEEKVVSKLASAYLLAAIEVGVEKETMPDNLIVRLKVSRLTSKLMDMKDNSGYFIEYDCKDIMNLKEICDSSRCQTLSYLGNKDLILPLIKSGIKGIDRIVPVGQTMDFDMVWDGYNLYELLTRVIMID